MALPGLWKFFAFYMYRYLALHVQLLQFYLCSILNIDHLRIHQKENFTPLRKAALYSWAWSVDSLACSIGHMCDRVLFIGEYLRRADNLVNT
jgi:hypothetical protein